MECEERKIIFEFLVTLGTAAVVKSNQLVWNEDLKLGDLATYYYIPTARKSCKFPTQTSQEDRPGQTQRNTTEEDGLACQVDTQSSVLFSLNGHTDEILQVCLCKLLLEKKCLLIPSKKMNTTAMRFHNLHQQSTSVDVTFIDCGNTIFIESNTIDSTIAAKEIIKMIVSTDTVFTDLSRQEVVDSLTSKIIQDSELVQIELDEVIRIAKKIPLQCTPIILSAKLQISDEWLQAHKDMTDSDQRICMIWDYTKRATATEFRNMMEELQ